MTTVNTFHEKKMIKYIVGFSLVVAMMVPAITKGQSAMNLRDAIDLALKSNRSVRADSLEITATAYRNKELAGSLLPQVNFSNSAEYNIALPSQMLPGTIAGQPSKDLVPVKFGTRYELSSGLEISQAIFRKDISTRVKAAELYTGIATTKYQLSKEELVYQVSSAYYGLQASRELVESTRRDYMNIKGVLDIAKAQFENGTLKKIDFQTLQINLANKQSQLDQLHTRYLEQLSWFNYLVGLPADAESVVSGDYNKVNALEIPTTEVGSRLDLNLYRQLIQSKMVDLKSTDAERLPSISSYFRLNMQSPFNDLSNAYGDGYRFKASSVGISVKMPIFDGNRRRNKLKATQVELTQLNLQSQQLNDRAQTEFWKASQTFNNNKQQLSITKENLDLAEKVFLSRKALYAEGVTTLIELLDSERELSQARSNYTQAMIDVQKGWLNVHKANGSLLTNYLNSL